MIILASFLTLVYIENEKANLGNLVNVSGKTRFLSLSVQLDFEQFIARDQSGSQVRSHLAQLENNIILVKDGGILNDLNIAPLPLIYHEQWDKLHSHFSNYERELLLLIDSDDVTKNQLAEISHINYEIINSADSLTNSISSDLSLATINLMYLQILFAVINIVAHVGLIYLILHIFKNHNEKLRKLEKFSTMGEMTARFAHDIRNPLTVIQHSSDIISTNHSHHFSDDDKRAIEKTNQSIKKIDSHLTDTLEYLRERPVEKESVDISLLISTVLEAVDIPPYIQITTKTNNLQVNCDKFQLERVLINLVNNSIDSISQKGTITIRVKEDKQFSIIKIMDSGPKIPSSEIDNLFEPLFTTKNEGTGLGLLSCKKIVENHDGTIEYEDSPKSFTIKLPK